MGKLALSAAGFAMAFSMASNLSAVTVLLVYIIMIFVQVLLARHLSNRLAGCEPSS